jgi:2,4-dienoyl-CoA reductase-like NADH-dependent reductase (Old Yellow Enzyme family)
LARQGAVTGIDGLLDRMERDEFDLVAVGRSLIANPDWATLALRGEVHTARPFDVSQLRTLN